MKEYKLTQGIYLIELNNIKIVNSDSLKELRKIYPYANIISARRIHNTNNVKVIFYKNVHDIWEGLI